VKQENDDDDADNDRLGQKIPLQRVNGSFDEA